MTSVERVRAMRAAQNLPLLLDATQLTRLALLLAPVVVRRARRAA